MTDLMDWAMNQGLGAVIALIFLLRLDGRLEALTLTVQKLVDSHNPPGGPNGAQT